MVYLWLCIHRIVDGRQRPQNNSSSVNIYELIEDDSSYQNVSTTRPRASSQPLSTDHTVLYSAQSASDEAPAASSKLDPANNNVYVPPAAAADNSSPLNDVPCCYQMETGVAFKTSDGDAHYANSPPEHHAAVTESVA